jgi:hypothetical protein
MTSCSRHADDEFEWIGYGFDRPSPGADGRLQDTNISAFLRGWSFAVLGSGTSFGNFCLNFLEGRLGGGASRCRDVLPLPVAQRIHVADWVPLIDSSVAMTLLNVACAGLNYLFFGNECGVTPSTATSLHRSVFRRICAKLDCACAELIHGQRTPDIRGSFGRLTSTADPVKFPSLRADDVDLLGTAGQLDPMSFLPSTVRRILETPSSLFPGGVDHIGTQRVDREPNRGDRVTLTLRLLRTGKLSLMRRAMASADTFIIRKSDGSRLREIWNGGRLTDAAVPSLKPPLQATPASLTTLEASDDRPVWASCRDGRVFFDQLRVPDSLRPFLGRPMVAVADLQHPPSCESGAIADEGLTDEELSRFVVDGPLNAGDTHVTPVSNTWPMGFGFSSYVAQCVMVSSCLDAGFAEKDILSAERLLLPGTDRALAIATDDVNLFERLSPSERAAVVDAPLACLDEVWVGMGLQGHAAKRTDLSLDVKTLGIELRGGVRLQARGSRLWTLLEASIDLLDTRVATPAALAIFNGHLQWHNLMNRPLYAVLHHVYGFIHQLPASVARPVGDQVLSEIVQNVGLFPFWSSDLRRPWWPCLPATDASPAYGFGFSMAKCDPDLSRAIAAAAAEPGCVIRLTRTEDDPAEIPRAGFELRIPAHLDDFKTVFSIRAKETSHSGAMELQAVKLALLRLTRSARLHGHRGVVLVDATAVGFALRKGRSSAGTLARGVRAVAAVTLAADLKLSFPYLPSESNPADFPSRGKVRKRTCKKRERPVQFCSVELAARAYRRASRRWRDCNSSVV